MSIPLPEGGRMRRALRSPFERDVLGNPERHLPVPSGPIPLHAVLKDASALLIAHRGCPIVPDPADVVADGPA